MQKDDVDAALERMGLPRTRENYIYALYGGYPPQDWDEDAEEQLPPDLRVT